MLAKQWVRWVLALGLAGIVVVASWMLLDTAFHLTGDYEFCTSCHGYEPIAAAYQEDTHGGDNAVGFRAACTDCHLPHDNSLHYFIVKAKHGIVDPTMALLKDPLDIDWHGNRENRKRFVYDSGCLSCHKNLQEQTQANPKSFRPHRNYFAAQDEFRCVQCHEHVGHRRLGYHLEKFGWQKAEADSL